MRTLLKLARMEGKLLFRDPLTVVFTFGFPFLVLLVLGAVFGNTPDPSQPEVFRGVGPMDYYVPGYVGLCIAAIGLIALPVHLAGYRERGVLRRFRASGLRTSTLLGAQALITVLTSTVGALLLVALGFVAYDVHAPVSPWGVLLGFGLSVACFASIGILLGALMPSARAAQGIGLMLFFVMMFLAGTDGPREVMGEVLRRIGDFLPLTHAIVTMQDPWIGFGMDPWALAIVVAVTALSAVAAVVLFRWD